MKKNTFTALYRTKLSLLILSIYLTRLFFAQSTCEDYFFMNCYNPKCKY